MTDNTPMLSSLVEKVAIAEQQTGSEPAFNIFHHGNMRELLVLCIEESARQPRAFDSFLNVTVKMAVYLIVVEGRFDRAKWDKGVEYRTRGFYWIFDLDLVLGDRGILTAVNQMIESIKQEYHGNYPSVDSGSSGRT